MSPRSRRVAAIMSFIIVASSLTSPALMTAGADEDPRAPGKVNKLLDFVTPGTAQEGMRPGDSGEFTMTVHNPYEGNLTNINVTAGIYMYGTIEEKRQVTDSWSTPYIEESGSLNYTSAPFDLNSGQESNITFTIVTSTDTPHGGIFSQSTYFMRFLLEFDYTNTSGTVHLVMKSPGYFSEDVWRAALREPTSADEPYYRGGINITYLNETSGPLDGIIPDSSFGLKDPIPMWPFYLLVGVIIVSAILALMFYLEENPGTWPWMEKRWFGFKGKLHQTFRLSRRGKGKGPGVKKGEISDNKEKGQKD